MIMTASRPIPTNRDPAIMRAYRAIFWNRVKMITRTATWHPDIVLSTFGKRELVSIYKPEYIYEVLVEQADKFHKEITFKRFTSPLLGNGLLLSEEDEHRRNRKLVAPAFIHRRIPEYVKTMTDYTLREMDSWKDGDVIDIWQEMVRITLGVTGKSLFGSDVTSDADEVKRYLNYLIHYADEQLRIPFHIPFSWKTPRNNKVRRTIAELDKIIYRMIAERRASKSDSGDFLSILLLARDDEDGSGMTDKQVRDEAMTIFLAGHETTANATTWMWYLLAQHPQIFRKLHDEVVSVCGNIPPTFDDLLKLPYAQQVFKEALRLYPPAYILARTANEDVFIDGYHIRKNAAVIIPPYIIHRNPDVFHDPEKFDPDRFRIEHEEKIPKYGYLPFGGGPRVCIGNQFAMIEGQIIAATIAQRFYFEIADSGPVEMEPLITLRPKGGIRVRVKARGVISNGANA
jgi:cytochrome P450